MTEASRDERRLEDEKRIRRIAAQCLPAVLQAYMDRSELEVLEAIIKRVDLSGRIEEAEALLRDMDEAEAPAAARAWLRAVRRKVENRVAWMHEELPTE